MRENILIISHNTHTFLINEIKYASSIFKRVVIICPYDDNFKKAINNLCNVDVLFYSKKELYKNVIFSLTNIFKKNKRLELLDSIKSNVFSKNYIKQFLYFLTIDRILKYKIANVLKLDYNDSSNWIFYSAWYYATAYAVTEAKKKYKYAKVISLAHSFEIDPIKNKFIMVLFRKQYHGKLDKVSFISKNVFNEYKENIAKNLGLDICNTEVRYLGVKKLCNGISDYSKDGIIRVVSCSHIVPVKRIDLIFRALENIKDIPIEWVHFGDGSQMKYIEELVKNNSNSNLTVKLLGARENFEIHNYYKNNTVDIFINLSKSEGIPVAIMEAIAYGIPIIATDVGGNSEIVNNDFGRLISANPTFDEIKHAIFELIYCTDEEKIQIRKNALNYYENFFNSDLLRYEFFTDLKNDDVYEVTKC